MDKKEVGEVLGLVLKKEKREQQKTITLDEGGVVGDKFYGEDLQRSILITSTYSYELANNKGIGISYGELGENILTDFNPYSLEIGTELHIGNTIIAISQGGTLCKGLTKINNKLPKLLKNDRGIFAKVIKGGDIKLGDKIYLI
jgi:MOSC domain-containing protein YiiM